MPNGTYGGVRGIINLYSIVAEVKRDDGLQEETSDSFQSLPNKK